MDVIKDMVADKPVVIFSKSSCCVSFSIKSLISSFGANPTVYEIDQISNGTQVERELLQLGSQPTVPAVFIGQKFIGGAHKIMSLHVQNELPTLLLNARAIWIWTPKKDS
ncbi:monothiol glutaredoxin-S1-like isoform X2 [Neltuma alba]|uniref:monothiol glutaredoxin-S1-like isoform X2 n=1 Tax=Neltuma alba TaxID=207710 RepID=UPI0010A49051|nr:monothiol glutaredoxin-S1-like isoform X2 [Prosopis alba]